MPWKNRRSFFHSVEKKFPQCGKRINPGRPEFNNGTPEAIYGGRSSRIAVAARGTFSEERFGRRVVGGM